MPNESGTQDHESAEAVESTPSTPDIDEQPFLDATSDAKSRYGRFNLAVIGGSGVGKSSLVNAVFGRDWAKTGKGLPVTRGVQYFNDDSLGIWDVEGFEIGSQLRPREQLKNHLAAIAKHDADRQIAVVWYCVKATDDRLTPADIEMIRELDDEGLPVILVVTKVDWGPRNPITGNRSVPKGVEEFVEWLQNPVDENDVALNIPYRCVILTSTRDRNGKESKHGLGELVAETLALAPEDEKDAFRIAQRLNLPWKRDMARTVVAAASATAAGAAAVPVPVADAAVLAPIQLGMMGRIATIYDLEIKTMLSAGALAQVGVQLAGRALASSLFKLIPGAGSVINAGVAAALTAATGEGWTRLCEQVHTGKIELDKVNDSVGDFVPGFLDVIRKMAEQKVSRS
ncbi:GTPase family protein [Microbacterium aquimaris]|uniref:GTPase n=1 Tax=Microbacterium aquimaris TaxID=459816 RepID=A0ABU5N3W7_9MICO|nr:GTPase [Microbacterium aquimaris]MDZ8160746.1 GTPase [Microbacterium aquimaris]